MCCVSGDSDSDSGECMAAAVATEKGSWQRRPARVMRSHQFLLVARTHGHEHTPGWHGILLTTGCDPLWCNHFKTIAVRTVAWLAK